MSRKLDLMLTALAPLIWGSTYVVTTELLPPGYPITVAMLRVLPAGLLLLLWVRRIPSGIWWGKIFILGALNIAVFQTLLFVAAYRLPGGVAATVGAIQPLLVIFLARLLINTTIRPIAIFAALAGIFGVGLLILSPSATLDPLGLIAGAGGAAVMAAGTVLSKKWQPPVSLMTFTAWQLSAGGLLLLPISMTYEPALPELSSTNIIGFLYLSLIGAIFAYFLWFRGVARLDTAVVSALGFLSPVSAVMLGWILLEQSLTLLQFGGVAIVLVSVWLSQRTPRV
jgi:probable blue pigment (indigoidine) exporter